jgi:hypothetical protein
MKFNTKSVATGATEALTHAQTTGELITQLGEHPTLGPLASVMEPP